MPTEIVPDQRPPGPGIHSYDLLLSAILEQTKVFRGQVLDFRHVAIAGQIRLRRKKLEERDDRCPSARQFLFGSLSHP